jgi:hypothetical protein
MAINQRADLGKLISIKFDSIARGRLSATQLVPSGKEGYRGGSAGVNEARPMKFASEIQLRG